MRDIWKDQAINDLELYKARKQSLINIPQQIAELESSMGSVRGCPADSVSVKGGNGRCDEAYLNNIVKRETLSASLKLSGAAVERVERSLLALSDDERAILDRFYINPERGAGRRIAMDMGVDEQTVYRRKNDALYKFTVAMYG